MQVRRRSPCFIQIDDTLIPDPGALLSGRVKIEKRTRIQLLCPINGEHIPLSAEELSLVCSLGSEWQDIKTIEMSCHRRVDALVERGALLARHNGRETHEQIAKSELRYKEVGWHPVAQLYHGMTRWSGVSGDEAHRPHGEAAHRARLEQHASRYGAIPTHFPRHPTGLSEVPLPIADERTPLIEALHKRRTTRHFQAHRTLPLESLATILRHCFGAFGTEELAPGMTAVRRTSPSGGALHPIEAYVLSIDVDGLDSGFHHYHSDTHVLRTITQSSKEEARSLAGHLLAGQTYFADAGAVVFHVARVDRHHWKYRNHPKAFRALLLDSGHLSQTFYLLAADLGLGAFYTAAINDADLEGLLHLNSPERMIVGANGIGIIDPSKDELHLQPTYPMSGVDISSLYTSTQGEK